MGKLTIRSTGISKRYTIQKRFQPQQKMLREQITQVFTNGIQQIKNRNGRKNQLDQIWALRDVSFTVDHGESVGIIGANGAGKTTLLKILSRITAPTEGNIKLSGRVGSLLEVGTGFHSELTGRENVYLNGAILGMKKKEIDRKFDEIVEFSGVEKFIDTPVKRFSTGMRMRLAFSVAAHLEPDILLIDEVLAVGDVAFQKKSLNKMEDVARQGRTVLFVSHNLAAVKAFCARSILLDHGQIIFNGDTNKAIELYLETNSTQYQPEEAEIDPTKIAQILRINSCTADRTPITTFQHDEPVYVYIKIHLSSVIHNNHVLLKINNSEMDSILVSRDFEPSGEFLIPTTPGVSEFIVKIPPNILIPGKYYLSAEIAGITSVNTLYTETRVEHAVSFEIEDNGSLLSQLNIPWRGTIHTDFEWKRL